MGSRDYIHIFPDTCLSAPETSEILSLVRHLLFLATLKVVFTDCEVACMTSHMIHPGARNVGDHVAHDHTIPPYNNNDIRRSMPGDRARKNSLVSYLLKLPPDGVLPQVSPCPLTTAFDQWTRYDMRVTEGQAR